MITVGFLLSASRFGSLTPIGSLIGALIGGFLTHKLGRKLSILMMCVPLATGWVAIIAADQVGWLYLGRILTGRWVEGQG